MIAMKLPINTETPPTKWRKTMETTNYQQQAQEIAKQIGLTMKVGNATYGRHFQDDKQSRYIFQITLKKDGRRYSFKFGQSINAGSEQPDLYDVLAYLQKYDVGTFENFCSEFGYDTDSRSAERTYKAVVKEYEGMCRLFSEQDLELLQEIQ